MAKKNKEPKSAEELLQSAETQAADIIKKANEEAEVILKEAREKGDKIIDEAETDAIEKIEAADEIVEKTLGESPAKNSADDDNSSIKDGCAIDRCWQYNGDAETGKIFEKGEKVPDGWTSKPTK